MLCRTNWQWPNLTNPEIHVTNIGCVCRRSSRTAVGRAVESQSQAPIMGSSTDCDRRPHKRPRISSNREADQLSSSTYNGNHNNKTKGEEKEHCEHEEVDRKRSRGRAHSSPPWRPDDKDGHYVFELGENLTPRYKILSKMGEGTFGRVLKCWDREKHEYVAIKVVRNVRKYRAAAMIEIDVLRTLAKHDKTGVRGCLQLKNWFDYRNHVCIVCEKLGPSLYDFLRKNSHRPFSVDLVREIGRQLLEAVAYMHDLTLTHTDLKPENILLVSSDYVKIPDKNSSDPGKYCTRVPTSSVIKLIDFGSATFETQHHCSVVSTRHYRAPEVILGLGWSYPCDLWSIGCILVELASGDALFQTHENLEHLAMMEQVLGPIPQHMIKKASQNVGKYFKNGRELNWPEGAVSRESVRAVRKLPCLRILIMQNVDHSAGALINLLQGLLKYDPNERLTAKEALKHDFFRERT